MKKVFLFLAIVAFVTVIAVPTYSVITINSSVVLDDPPKTKEVTKKEADKKEDKTAKKETKSKEDCATKCATKTSCCSKDKKN